MREEDIRRIIMWLPKDERRLLQGYYIRIRTVEGEKCFRISSWIPVLTSRWVNRGAMKVKEYDQGELERPAGNDKRDVEQVKEGLKKYIGQRNRLEVANKVLEKRGLVKRQKHKYVDDVEVIALTIDGYDLGRRYSKWFTRTGLWFAEYRNHWIWLIVSFFGGVLGAVLVNWLYKVLIASNSPR